MWLTYYCTAARVTYSIRSFAENGGEGVLGMIVNGRVKLLFHIHAK